MNGFTTFYTLHILPILYSSYLYQYLTQTSIYICHYTRDGKPTQRYDLGQETRWSSVGEPTWSRDGEPTERWSRVGKPT